MTGSFEWLGVEATEDPLRWVLPVTAKLSVRSRFLFGGSALGAAVAALETVTDRPAVWATAQYLSFAEVGSVMHLDATIAVAGHHTTQARVIGHVDDTEILTVNAALGRRDLAIREQWQTPPRVRPPTECEPRESGGAESLGHHVPQRWAVEPDGSKDGPTGHGPARVCVWARTPAGLEPSAATLAVLGDWVPMGIGSATTESIRSNSLDNTLRVVQVVPTDWYLLEIEPAAIHHGFGHGQAKIWSGDGTLMAVASQSVIVRSRSDQRELESRARRSAGGPGLP